MKYAADILGKAREKLEKNAAKTLPPRFLEGEFKYS